MTLEQQKRELRHDIADISTERRSAQAEEKRLRELVELYGNREARPLLERARAVLADLDVQQPKIEAQLLDIEKQLEAEGYIVGRVRSLTNEFSLTPEQSAQVEQLLRSGKPLKDVQQTARRWEIEAKAQVAPMPAFNSPDGVAW